MAPDLGVNYHDIKAKNRALIFRMLSTGRCKSRVELSKETGLTKMSVSNIISDLISHRILNESVPTEGRSVGRTPIILDIAEDGPKVIGLHISRTGCGVALCDLKLSILKSKYKTYKKKSREGVLEMVLTLIDEILEECSDVFAIGIGTLGPLDIENGIILNPPNFFGITNIRIVDLLKSRYGLPVYMDSQYNNVALAEKYYGYGSDFDDFIYLGITDGIGSGVVLNGKLLSNSSMLTSEVGHTSIDYHGNYCDCGSRGCLETYASSSIIRSRLNLETGYDKTFEEYCGISSDLRVDKVLKEMMEYLSYGLVSSINLINPQAVMLGDKGIYIPDKYLTYLEELINSNKLSKTYNYVRVVRPRFGKEAMLAGSAVCVLEQMFQGNLYVNEVDN